MLRTLALFNPFPARSQKIKSQPKIAVGSKTPWLSISLIVVNVLLLLSYVLAVNSSAAAGYQITQMQSQFSTLAAANQSLNLQVSEISSIVQIQAAAANSDFVAVGTPQFLQLNQNQLSER